MEASVLENIKEKIAQVESDGHGEVIIKIKNGHVWRILQTYDTLLKEER